MTGVTVSGVLGTARAPLPVPGPAMVPPGSPMQAGSIPRRAGRFMLSGMGAALLAAMMLQAVAELARYGAEGDNTLSVLLGLAAVTVTMLPITLLLLRRAVKGWRGGDGAPGE